MNAQDLKNSILQLAIQGKLVEQRKEEGTAKELIKKIEAEKKQLIKEGKIKKQKALPEIKEDEIPFDIPESWEWLRLSDVCLLTDGVKVNNVSLPYLEARYLRGKIDPKIKKSGKFINKGEYVILVDGENSGEVFITEEEGIIGSTFKVLSINGSMYDKYILNLLRFYQRLFRERKRGAAIPHLDKTLFKTLVIGIPPLEEQKRIVAKIEELMPYVDKYDVAYSEVEELNKKFPEDMQKSILQYAIQGKLVEQREEDGTAEDLISNLLKTKKRLVEEKKIYKKKPTEPFYTLEDVPFDIPDSWRWVQLSEISIIQEGAGIRKYQYRDSGVQLFSVTNILEGNIDLEKKKLYVSNEEFNEKYTHLQLNKNDIVTACSGGSWGKVAIYDQEDVVMLNTSTLRLRFFEDLAENKYLYYVVQSAFFKKQLQEQLVGIQPNFGYAHYSRVCLPLPPLEEQKRIVAKIEELLPYTKQLIKKID